MARYFCSHLSLAASTGIVAFAIFVLFRCSPDVGDSVCESDGDCFVGEGCNPRTHRCEGISDGLDSSDSDEDAPSDGDIRTPDVTDASDVTDSTEGLADIEDGRSDPADASEDADGGSDEPVDAPDDETTFVCATEGAFHDGLELSVFQPCRPNLGDHNPTCRGDGWAYDDTRGCSTWQRIAEPVEIPLVNGIRDQSVLVHLPFDDDDGFAPLENRGSAGPLPLIWPDATVGPGTDELGEAAVMTAGEEPMNLFLWGLGETSPWTLSFWVSTDGSSLGGDNPAQRTLLSVEADGGNQLLKLEVDATTYRRWMRDISDDTHMTSFNRTAVQGWRMLDEWDHIALVWPAAEPPYLVINGLRWDFPGGFEFASDPVDAIYLGSHSGAESNETFVGSIDDVVGVSRRLSRPELRAYYESVAPFGTSLLDCARGDLGDLRLLEVGDLGPGASDGGSASSEDYAEREIIGVRPAWEDRVEMVAHWPFDAATLSEESLPVYANMLSDADATGLSTSISLGLGRFGWDEDKSLRVDEGVGSVSIGTSSQWWTSATLSQPFTISFWVYVEEPGDLFGYESAGLEALLLTSELDVDDDLISTFLFRLKVRTEGGLDEEELMPYEAFDLKRWYHLTVMRRNHGLNDEILLYVDGLYGDSATLDDGAEIEATSPLEVYVGAANRPTEERRPFTGYIDDLVMYHEEIPLELVRRRSWPPLPTLRFLTKASDGGAGEACPFEYPRYRLLCGHTDLEDALIAEGDCIGLLSPCHGYAGFWQFDADLGEIARDSSERGHHLVFGDTEGSPVRWCDGAEGGSATCFDGLGAWLGSSARVDPLETWGDGNEITIETLHKRHAQSSDPEQIVSFVDTSAAEAVCRGFELYVAGEDKIEFQYDRSGGTCGEDSFEFLLEKDITPEAWYQIALVHTFNRADFTLWLNQNEESGDFTGSGIPVTTADALFVGGDGAHAEDFFNGAVDSVRIMTRMLSEGEMLHHPLSRNTAWLERDKHEPFCLETGGDHGD